MISAVACQSDEAASDEEATAQEESMAEGSNGEPEAAAPGEGEKPRSMKEVMQAVTQSVKDSKESETGDTICERAYSGQMAMSKNLMKALGSKEAPPEVDREGFLELCQSAPEEVQQCLVPSYAIEHREECRAIKDEAGPEFAAKLRALSQKQGEEAPAE